MARREKIIYWLVVLFTLGVAVWYRFGPQIEVPNLKAWIIAMGFILALGYLSFKDEENSKKEISSRIRGKRK